MVRGYQWRVREWLWKIPALHTIVFLEKGESNGASSLVEAIGR